MDRSTAAEVTYRSATASEVPTVVSLVESAYRGESSRAGWTTEAHLLDGRRTDDDAVAAIVGGNRSRIVVAITIDGEIVGCCQLEEQENGVCYFGMFAIRPTAQGLGLGSGLLREAQRIAREEWGSVRMTLSVLIQRLDLIAWYERCGFVATGETVPFPYEDRRFGLPRREDLAFQVMTRPL